MSLTFFFLAHERDMDFNLDLKRERKTGVSDFKRQRKHGSWMNADFFAVFCTYGCAGL